MQKITITELTRYAGVNRKTFYRYFYTMEDVLRALESDLLNDLTTAINSLHPFDIHSFLGTLNQLILKNEPFYKALITHQENSFFLQDAQKILKNGLIERANSTSIDAGSDFYFEFISGGIIQLYSYWLKDNHQLSLTELVQLLDEYPIIIKNSNKRIALKSTLTFMLSIKNIDLW